MARYYGVIALIFAVTALVGAAAAAAQPDPFASPDSGSSAGPAETGSGSGSGSERETELTPHQPAAAQASPACEYITRAVCSRQDTALLLKSGAYVLVVVLLFSVLRVWWDKRGTNTAGVRFIATLLPAATAAGVLAYLDPARGQDLACCLASPVFKSEILLQDSALGRGALLGFAPAAALFVLVAITLKLVKR